MQITVTEGLTCPRCGAGEVENPTAPVSEWKFNIRAYKVCDAKGVWWSQCWKCVEAAGGDRKAGWFK